MTTKQKLESMYDVADVQKGYKYWQNILINKVVTMFDYTGLDNIIDDKLLERYLLLKGSVAFFDDKIKGLQAINGATGGFDQHTLSTVYMISNPILDNKTYNIDINCIVMYCTTNDYFHQRGISDMINRYARLLSDVESSINIATVNTRHNFLFTATSQGIANNIKEVLNRFALGFKEVVNINNIVQNANTLQTNTNNNVDVQKLFDLRQNILNAFLSEIGVASSNVKRERMITDEVTNNKQVLTVNIQDMLEHRQKAVEKVNKMFKTDITVKLSNETHKNIIENDEVNYES